MSRPRGRKNTRPTQAEVSAYYQLLKSAASDGDVDAARHLIELHHMTNQSRTQRQENTNG